MAHGVSREITDRREPSYPEPILHSVDLDWYLRAPHSRRSALPVVVFDGDDTLWATEALYDVARDRSAALVEAAGLDAALFDKLQRDIDVINVSRYGLSALRFPTSSREAYEKLAIESGGSISQALARKVYQASAGVFDAPAPMEPHAHDVLGSLRSAYRLTVLTKGDAVVQRRRVDDSGLKPLLDAVCIVQVKDAAVFTAMLDVIGADSGSSWSVGNSYGSDVHPAVMAGMRAVWIDAPVWAHERSLSERVIVKNDPNVFVAEGLIELPKILHGTPRRRLAQ